jgi:transposase
VPVSHEQRRPKTDSLDIGLLKRSFIGWLRGLRGEKKHCTMVTIPTLDEKERNAQTGSASSWLTGIINRMKATLVRLGIRGFNPKLRNASERLPSLRTPEGRHIPPNTPAELQREMAHPGFINQQINQIEGARQELLKDPLLAGSNTKVSQLKRVHGVGIETADMLAHEMFSRALRDQRTVARYAGLTGSPDESG